MSRTLSGTRCLVVIPVFGVACAAPFFFLFGSIWQIRLLSDSSISAFSNQAQQTQASDRALVCKTSRASSSNNETK